MNAYTTEPYSDSYSSPAPVLIAGDSDLALNLAAQTVEAAGSRIGAVVAAPRDLVDLLFSRIGGAPVELVIDGDEAERAAALAIATSGIYRETRLSDVASDRSTERLRQLSDEVSRIASTLARLSTGPSETHRPEPVPPSADVPPVSPTRCVR